MLPQIKYYLKRYVSIAVLGLIVIYLLHPERFAKSYSYILKSDITKELSPAPLASKYAKEHNKTVCPLIPVDISDSLMYPDTSLLDYDKHALAQRLGVKPGGLWQPTECESQHQVAIIIPYRNRSTQLSIFLAYMHPFLQKQFLNYRIIVIEQSNNQSFNRAKLFNIGYNEAMKIHPYHCFIFQDVDLIPQKLSNMYSCTHSPRHMSSSLDTFRYNLPYLGLFGGAVAILQKQFQLVNGFSNVFFGWGGEDDDFYERIENKGLSVCRFDPSVAMYVMLTHKQEAKSENRYEVLRSGRERFDTDGINSLHYEVKSVVNEPLSTQITVDI